MGAGLATLLANVPDPAATEKITKEFKTYRTILSHKRTPVVRTTSPNAKLITKPKMPGFTEENTLHNAVVIAIVRANPEVEESRGIPRWRES